MIDIFKKFHKTFVLAFVCLLPLGSAQDVNDPFEKVNRGIFQFNILDDNVFVPIAKGWRQIPDIQENLFLIICLPKHQLA